MARMGLSCLPFAHSADGADSTATANSKGLLLESQQPTIQGCHDTGDGSKASPSEFKLAATTCNTTLCLRHVLGKPLSRNPNLNH